MTAESGISLSELAGLLGGHVHGEGEREIRGVQSLTAADASDIAPFTDPRYRGEVAQSRAGALLVATFDADLGRDQLVCEDVGWALAKLLGRFESKSIPTPGWHPTAVVDPSAEVAKSASLGPFVVVGPRAFIDAEVVLHAGVVLGEGCRVGEGSILYPRAVLYDGTELGRRVIVHAGAVLGSDGFGYVLHGGRMVKVPQIGRLVVGDDVEIGANTTIDRATLDQTSIGAGSKLDNLVQVGHNVRLGEGCVICGQAGIAGSTRLGRGVVMGGQSGSADHLELGDGVQVAAASAVLQDVEAGQKVGGVPATPLGHWRRVSLLVARLPELFRRLRALEIYRETDRAIGSGTISGGDGDSGGNTGGNTGGSSGGDSGEVLEE